MNEDTWRRSRFLGRDEGQLPNFTRRVQTVQRRVLGKGLGSCFRQASQVVWLPMELGWLQTGILFSLIFIQI